MTGNVRWWLSIFESFSPNSVFIIRLPSSSPAHRHPCSQSPGFVRRRRRLPSRKTLVIHPSLSFPKLSGCTRDHPTLFYFYFYFIFPKLTYILAFLEIWSNSELQSSSVARSTAIPIVVEWTSTNCNRRIRNGTDNMVDQRPSFEIYHDPPDEDGPSTKRKPPLLATRHPNRLVLAEIQLPVWGTETQCGSALKHEVLASQPETSSQPGISSPGSSSSSAETKENIPSRPLEPSPSKKSRTFPTSGTISNGFPCTRPTALSTSYPPSVSRLRQPFEGLHKWTGAQAAKEIRKPWSPLRLLRSIIPFEYLLRDCLVLDSAAHSTSPALCILSYPIY